MVSESRTVSLSNGEVEPDARATWRDIKGEALG